MPKVSVIVPNYNHAGYLSRRLDSIFNQTCQDFEVILLDDCSTDNSREILEAYKNHPKVTDLILNEQNSGSTFKQWEKGILHSSGEYIWIAESDDYSDKNFLATLVDRLDQFPEAGIAYCQSVSVDEENKIIGNWIDHTQIFSPNIWEQSFHIAGIDAIKNLFVYINIIPNTSGVIFRRKVYQLTTGFENWMKLNGDWFFWIKMLEKSDLVFIDRNLNCFRQHNQKVTLTRGLKYSSVFERYAINIYLKGIGITKNQKTELTRTMIELFFLQAWNSTIYENIIKIPAIFKALFKFNPLFICSLLPVAIQLLFRKFTHKISHSQLVLSKEVCHKIKYLSSENPEK